MHIEQTLYNPANRMTQVAEPHTKVVMAYNSEEASHLIKVESLWGTGPMWFSTRHPASTRCTRRRASCTATAGLRKTGILGNHEREY